MDWGDNLGLNFYPYKIKALDQTSAGIWFWNMGIIKIWQSYFRSFWKENFESYYLDLQITMENGE